MNLRLYKKEKLCSVTAINTLFSRDAANFTASAFPLRVFWRYNNARHADAPMQFLISVPKRRLRHAVDRVTMRRRIREAYRLQHQDFQLPQGVKVDVAFLYVDSRMHHYGRIAKCVRRLLEAISRQTHEDAECCVESGV